MASKYHVSFLAFFSSRYELLQTGDPDSAHTNTPHQAPKTTLPRVHLWTQTQCSRCQFFCPKTIQYGSAKLRPTSSFGTSHHSQRSISMLSLSCPQKLQTPSMSWSYRHQEENDNLKTVESTGGARTKQTPVAVIPGRAGRPAAIQTTAPPDALIVRCAHTRGWSSAAITPAEALAADTSWHCRASSSHGQP